MSDGKERSWVGHLVQLASTALLACGLVYGLIQAGNEIGGSLMAGASTVSGSIQASMPNVASAPLGRFVEPAQQLSTAAERFVDLADRGWPWPFMRPATK
jgi:hypothetical protein